MNKTLYIASLSFASVFIATGPVRAQVDSGCLSWSRKLALR